MKTNKAIALFNGIMGDLVEKFANVNQEQIEQAQEVQAKLDLICKKIHEKNKTAEYKPNVTIALKNKIKDTSNLQEELDEYKITTEQLATRKEEIQKNIEQNKDLDLHETVPVIGDIFSELKFITDQDLHLLLTMQAVVRTHMSVTDQETQWGNKLFTTLFTENKMPENTRMIKRIYIENTPNNPDLLKSMQSIQHLVDILYGNAHAHDKEFTHEVKKSALSLVIEGSNQILKNKPEETKLKWEDFAKNVTEVVKLAQAEDKKTVVTKTAVPDLDNHAKLLYHVQKVAENEELHSGIKEMLNDTIAKRKAILSPQTQIEEAQVMQATQLKVA
ncbi:MAG: hypothetical protein HRK26_05250 [Rickettsiaceae bacterium H1]|nr:hypothetical protein [Rickettsiaceae bacterium H1]